MKQPLLKSSLILALLFLVSSSLVGQADVQLQFVNGTGSGGSCPSGSPDQFCATLQIMGNADFQLGASDIWLEYDLDAIIMPDAPTMITPLNFDDDFDATNYLNASAFSQEDFPSTPGRGEVQYSINTPSGAIPGAETIPANTWTDVATFCWNVVDASQTTGIDYVDQGVLGIKNTDFNNASPNNGSAAHNITSVTGIDVPIECPTDILVNLTVLLEGPYTGGGMMGNTLQTGPFGDLFPNSQPFTGAPWNYAGGETIVSKTAAMIDWVLVDAATDIDFTNAPTIIERKAGILLNNGSIINADGTPLSFATLTSGQDYSFIVRHRNHLDVVTPNPITVTQAGPNTFDFTTAIQVFNGFVMQQKDGGDGSFVMRSGDIDNNMNINATDRGIYEAQSSMFGQYFSADMDMNQVTNAVDRGLYEGNSSVFGVVGIAAQ